MEADTISQFMPQTSPEIVQRQQVCVSLGTNFPLHRGDDSLFLKKRGRLAMVVLAKGLPREARAMC
jgi:hypothetical protein